MCGIAGFLTKNNYTSCFQKLFYAKDVLLHRGPDDSGIFTNESDCVGLTHTRLSIIDTSSAGHQPMLSSDGKIALVFNGEIYNYKDLRVNLIKRKFIFKSESDTEVLLNLYLQYRNMQDGLKKMLNLLNGIFSFSIWDSDNKQLLLVRDAIGVKPLYYLSDNESFAFASELKALLPYIREYDQGIAAKPTKINQNTNPSFNKLDIPELNRYLTFLWCPGAGSPSKLIRKLCPGEAMLVKDGRINEIFSWYMLPTFKARNFSQKRSSKKHLINGTENHLRRAVHRQMVSDVPVGAFLSGGLDSSSVVAFAREQSPSLNCFTIDASGSSNEGMTDDLPYAKFVADHLKVPLDVISVDPYRMAMDLPNMVAQLDEPLADPAALNVLYISRLARQNGIKVLLSGAGGDDLFTGYRRHRALSVEKYWKWLPDSILSFLESTTENLNTTNPFLRRFRKLFNGATLKGDNRLVNYFRWINRSDLFALYTSDFRSELSTSKSEEPMIDFLSNLPSETEDLERLLALEQRFFLTDHNLTYTDKMSMAEGVEVRVPFLDLDLIEFASQIPSYYKQRGSEGKWILKKAMEPYLPRDVIYRSKTGFGAPLRRWLKVELRDWLAETLSPRNVSNRGFFEPQAVQRLINDNASGRIDASYTLFSLACIEMWCKSFLDKPVAQNSNQ
jgi:asparagine synthase (glutamine-hydrolysing)